MFERLYRRLLRAYPAEFREEYEAEMLQTYRDRATDEPAPHLWADLALDLIRTAPKEQFAVLLNDIRYAFRMMRKAPLFASSVILTVALGIGATTAIFTVVNAVILRPLPFKDPDRLIQVAEKNDKLHLPNFTASVLNYLSWKEQQRSFEELGAIGNASEVFSGRGEPEQFNGSPISPSVMRILGLKPIVGREFQDGEDKPNAAHVVMLDEGVWRSRFGGDASIIGQTRNVNGVPTEIIGVAPAALKVMTNSDVFVPLTIDPGREFRLNHVILVIGRLKPGVTRQQAQAEMDAISRGVGQQYPEVKDWGISLVTFYDTFVTPQLQTALLVLLASVGFVLLIACANIANLLLARAVARQREIAVRTAMGASRSRLLRQMLAESMTFAVIGGGIGTALAFAAVRAINVGLPPNVLPIPQVTIDGTVLAFAGLATIGTGVLFGVIPAYRLANADLNETLKSVGRAVSGSRPVVRNTLAAAELALATLLLIGAGLLVQTLLQLERVHLGFDPHNVVTFQLSPPQSRYDTPKAVALYRRVLDTIREVPGVKSAGISSAIPFGAGAYTRTPTTTDNPTAVPPGTAIPIDWRIVSPDYFKTMGMTLIRGRLFTDNDGPTAQQVMIVSHETAMRFWGSDDVIGRTIRPVARTTQYTIVGVVSDVRHTNLNQEFPAMYYPSAGRLWPSMDVAVRVDGAADAVLTAIRQKIHDIDPELPLANVRPMEEWVAASAAQPRLNALLIALFAGVALLLSALGIYGVIAYSVSQRTRELGLRMALGAQRSEVVGLVVREGMTVGSVGVAIGVVLALALSRVLSSIVFGVDVRDPKTFVSVTLTLIAVALMACALPARRASRVDPMVALREE
ncbi:MAG TPA: ABC transporter permease [Vicinamibacterales bacterium]|nr:ABC transporter permease [Vicinamibacterales bacterium]